jgi:ATP-binding cassette subfamily B protein
VSAPAEALRRSGAASWRAFASLLWAVERGRVVWLAFLVLLTGLLPAAVMLATGALVRAVPAVEGNGLFSPAGRPALLALAALAGGLALAAAAQNALWQAGRALDAAFAFAVHDAATRAALAPAGVAPLEDPAFAARLQAVDDAERTGVLQTPVSELATVLTTRLRGLAAFAIVLAFRWWAPLVLAVAWQLTNRLYMRTMARGISARMGDGAARLRRSEYLRSLALEPAAAKEVRVFGLAQWMVGRYTDAWREAIGVLWANRRANRWLTALAATALGASHAWVLGALGTAAARGEIGVAALFVFAQAVLATADLGLIGDAQWWSARALDLAGRVAALRADAGAAEPPPALAPAERGQVSVRLEGVRFAYPGRPAPALDGLTLHVPAGQSLAVVGENGAGKSTLIKLLCGLYEPQAGRITLGGGRTPLEARGRVGVIFQDFVRYPLPLAENVGFGHLPLLQDRAALAAALADAGGGALPGRLPHGWDTVLSREFEGGADLSGGQWQRVALARALAAVRGGAGLLILDEPTASLDVRAETELFERFLELTRGVTTILVSHRLSSVRRADRIVVIDGGRVVEDGSHDELMSAGGRYAEMFTLQARRFAAATDGEEVDDA